MQITRVPTISDSQLEKRLNHRLETFSYNGDHYDKKVWKDLTKWIDDF